MSKMNFSRSIFLPVIGLIAASIAIIDQAFKKLAGEFLFSPIYINDNLSLEIYKNSGIAFGLPVNSGVFYFVVFLFFAMIVSGKFFSLREMEKKEIIGIALIAGGAAGNIIDRVRFGYIVDFINVKNFIIFNLADVFIAIGALMLAISFIPDKTKKRLNI